MSRKLKITETVLSNGHIIKTIYFKSHTFEQFEAEKYLDSINACVICTTYLDNGKGYIDYYIKKL